MITIVSGIILARILNPEDFGMVYLAQIVLTTAGLVTALGMGAAVIQSQEDRASTAYHGFVVTLISGMLTFLILQLTTPVFADLLGSRDLEPVLRWMLIMLLFNALTVVPEALLQKQLLFGRVSGIVVSGELLYLGIAIGLALAGFGLWSLVYANLIRSLFNAGLMWLLLPGDGLRGFRPWDWPLARRLLRYGMRTTGSGLTTFLYQTIDNFVVGRFLGPTAIGYYGRAMDFTSRTVDGFSNVIGTVLFPSFSVIQRDRQRLSRAYFTSLRATSFVTVPLALGILITAEEMVNVLLGSKWVPMIPALQILAFVSLVKPLSASTAALFFAVGKPEFNMRAGLVVLVALIVGIVLFLPWGFPGVAFAVLVAHILGFGFNLYQVHRVLPGMAFRVVSAFVPALVAGIVMVGAVHLSKAPLSWLGDGSFGLAELAAMVLIGGAVYGSLLFVLQRALVTEIVSLARSRNEQRGSAAEVSEQ